jgi:phage tail-like protein
MSNSTSIPPTDDWSGSERHLARSLPEIFRGDPTTEALLSCFESVLFGTSPQTIPNSLWARLHATYEASDPQWAPTEFLNWLGTWIGLSFTFEYGEEAKRQILRHAVYLYQWRGTRLGIEQTMQILTGCSVVVSEPEVASLRVGVDSVVGRSTRLGRELPHRFQVNMQSTATESSDFNELEGVSRFILNVIKPAQTTYTLKISGCSADGPPLAN